MFEVAQTGLRSRAKLGWARDVLAFSRRRPLGALGAAFLVLWVMIAIFAPIIATHDPLGNDTPNQLRSPDSTFWFGTDTFGRDQFSRIVFGARVSLYVGLLAVLLSTTTGTVVGVSSAYFGSWLDLGVQRFVDALQGMPSLVIALAMVVALGASVHNVTLAIGLAYLPRVTRIARAQAMSVKGEDYVLAARAVGASSVRVMFRHVALNSLTPVIVVGAGLLGNAVVTEAGLSFLGLGVPPPHPSWGRMLQFGAKGYLQSAPWLTIFPGLALATTVFGFNLFGDALRDALDPRLRGR